MRRALVVLTIEQLPGQISVSYTHLDVYKRQACGYDPYLAEASPYHGGYFAVLSALSKILAMGGNPLQARLSLQEYFGKTVDPQSWGQPLTALLGAFDAMLDFGVPAIGGKDSMSGTFENLSVPPSLIAFAVGLTSVDKVISATLKLAGDVYKRQIYDNALYMLPASETSKQE